MNPKLGNVLFKLRMSKPLRKLHTRLRGIKSGASGVAEALPELEADMETLLALDAKLQANEQVILTGLSGLQGTLADLEMDYEEEREDENRLLLSGTLCKPPSLRSTPLGRTICDMILAVNRRYGRADYLPCIAWGSLAHLCGEMAVGSSLGLDGRLQSRTYTKNLGDRVEERTAFEVSIMNLLPLEEVRLGRELPVREGSRGAI